MFSGLIRTLLISSFWFCAMVPAYACSPQRQTTEADDFRAASYVFHALLVETRLSDFIDRSAGAETGRPIVHGRYELMTSLKGDAPARGVVTTLTGIIGGCAVPLLAEKEYIFFVEPLPETTPADLRRESLGTVSIFGSRFLTSYDPGTQEEIERLRKYDAK